MIYVYSNGQSVVVSLETSKENLPAVTKLVTDYLRNPTFPDAEFNKLKEERLAMIESQKQEPNSIAWNVSERTMNPYPKGHPFYTQTFDEEIADLKKMTIADVRQFYKDFYGTQNGSIAVVGTFDEAPLKAKLKKDLGSWKAAKSYTRIPTQLFADLKPKTEAILTDDKANAMIVMGLKFPMRDDDPDYPALYMANYILGDGFLKSHESIHTFPINEWEMDIEYSKQAVCPVLLAFGVSSCRPGHSSCDWDIRQQ